MRVAQVTLPPSTQIYGMFLNQLYQVSTPPRIPTESSNCSYRHGAFCHPLHAANHSLEWRISSYNLINKQTKNIPLSMSCYKQAKQAAGPHLRRCYINCKRDLQIFLMQIFLGKQKAAVYSCYTYQQENKIQDACISSIKKNILLASKFLWISNCLKYTGLHNSAAALLLQQASRKFLFVTTEVEW